MTDYASLEQRLVDSLRLHRRPVAVTFCDSEPAGVARFAGTQPAGCAFWRLAADGRAFYTAPGDHYNCAIGCYTHRIPLPEKRADELSATIGFMTEIGYIKPQDVGAIAQLATTPRFVVYAPLAQAPLPPDVVLLVGKPGAIMLLEEAAISAGVATEASCLGRPTCMAIPVSMVRGITASSGCVGNRVYTGLAHEEMYLVVPGKDVAGVANALDLIVAANDKLLAYHRDRSRQLTAS